MKATRVFQLTALALVVVAAVQVGYWLFDQRTKAMERVRAEHTLYLRQVGAAQVMLESGVSAERVQQLGGNFSIGNKDGRGVSLTAEIPLDVPA